MNRIQRLLFPPLPARTWAPLAAAVILIASTGTGFAAWHMSPQAGVSASHGDAWQKWLNEDVVYIISAQERAAFGGLRTDDEREHFVEQFWERRNPKAGAAPNEFKQEHYRRIVFANKHFGSSTQGWVTDRGRIYIVYGPPDEIDSHLAHGGNSLATEEWLYHHSSPGNKDGVFFFIDRDGTGDYRLAPAPQ